MFYELVGHGQRLVGEGDQPRDAPGGAYGVPVVGELAQVDEDVAGKQRLAEGHPLAVADLFYLVIRAVAGEQLVTQMLQGAFFLPGFALEYVPLGFRRSF